MATVILVHGLAHWPFVWASNAAMTPLGWYLERQGYRVVQLSYNGDHEHHDDIVTRLVQAVDAAAGDVHIVGHSYGGILGRSAAQLRNGKVRTVVAIASPLNGAAFLTRVESVLPWMVKGSHGYAKIKAIVPNVYISPVCLRSVSVGLPGIPDFDSCVYRTESTGTHGHAHIEWCEHRLAPLDPRVWSAVHAHLVAPSL